MASQLSEGKEPADPDQRELPFIHDRKLLPALREAPWQVEAAYRILLDTGVISVSLGAKRVLEWLVKYLGFAHLPRAEAIMEFMFSYSIVVMAFTMVFFDLARFIYRRTPASWRRKLGWLGK